MEDNQNDKDESEELQRWLDYRERGWSFAAQQCSFCGTDREEWIQMLGVDDVLICEHCIELCIDALADQRGPRCGFCGKHSDQVELLITGKPNVAICDACVGLCQEVIKDRPTDNDE